MPKNPFSFSDDLELEQNPAVSGTRQAAKQAGNAIVKQTGKQIAKTTQAIVAQLYGATDSSSSNETAPQPPQQKSQPTLPQSAPQPTELAKQPSADQEKIENARRELHKMAYGQQFSLDSQRQRVREQEKQDAQRKQQNEAEEIQQKQQVEQANLQALEQPQGKTRDPRQKKRQMVLSRIQTKAETNQRASG